MRRTTVVGVVVVVVVVVVFGRWHPTLTSTSPSTLHLHVGGESISLWESKLPVLSRMSSIVSWSAFSQNSRPVIVPS